jgi:hypothetical protein
MFAARGDFIHADKATVQVVYDAQVKKERVALTPTEDGGYYEDGADQPFDGEVLEDPETGEAFYEREVAENQEIRLVPICFDEVLHTPEAKSQDEIRDIAYRFSMSKDECIERYGEEKCKNLPWKQLKDSEEEGRRERREDTAELYIEGWEIWCKRSRKVYVVIESHAEFLDVREDLYGLRNFFPSPAFIIGSKPPKSLYPRPAYVHLSQTIDQLHMSYARVFELIQGVRRRALVDGANPDLLVALNSLDSGEYIAVQNLQQIVEKGGLANMILYLPVQELVSAVNELLQLRQVFDDLFSQWFGVPDILRGVSDPQETAEAQGLKAGSAHDRFRCQKRQIAQLARDAVEMMLDLALQVFDDQKIASICGYQYLDPEDQQRFPDALALLRNDEERIIRLDIETDSTSFMDERLRQERRNVAAQAVMGGLKEVAAMAQNSPGLAAVAMQAVSYSLDGLEGGREFEDEFKQNVQGLVQQMMNPPQQPPPPDYEQMKLQVKTQELQLKQMELQMKQMTAQREQDRLDFQAQMQAQDEAHQRSIEERMVAVAEFNSQIGAQEAVVEENRLMIEATKPPEPKAEAPKAAKEPSTVIVNAPRI